MDNLQGVGYSLNALGLLALRWGVYARAKAHLEESVTHFRRLQDSGHTGFQLLCLAFVTLMQRNYPQAKGLLAESLSLDSTTPGNIISALEAFGRIAAAQGQPARATRLFGAVEAMSEIAPQTIHFSVIRSSDPAGYIGVLTAVRAELTEDAFTTAWSEGRAMAPEQAVAYALQSSEMH